MWGGWYKDETYMAEMREFLEISKNAVNKPMGSVSEIAVFVDEKSNKYCPGGALAYVAREALGKIGAPYDCFLASDYRYVKDKYKAVIVIDQYRTPEVDLIISDCEKRGVGCFVITAENAHTESSVLREFCRNHGAHIYADNDAVVYANESYIFVHCCGNELPKLILPEKIKLNSLYESEATRPAHPDFVSALYEKI